MRETARRFFRFHAFRRILSVVVLILIDAAALSVGILDVAYFAGAGQEMLTTYLPIVLAVGLALFAAQDLYDRAAARRKAHGHGGVRAGRQARLRGRPLAVGGDARAVGQRHDGVKGVALGERSRVRIP